MGNINTILSVDDQLVKDIKKEAEDSLAETMWEGYANDIITGIQNNNGIEPDRAIWELVQNARDVSKEDCNTEIVFTRRKGSFEFRHNGQPFTRKSIQALILQTSSKVRHDIVQVGQYGTGFLTTHKFGLRYKLSGALQLLGSDKYYNFSSDDLLIDRSSKDKIELSRMLGKQINTTQAWGEDIHKLVSTPFPFTVFTYLHDYSVEYENVEKAFHTSPALTSYVLALNKYVGSITFRDEINNSEEAFCFISSEKDSEYGNCIVNCVNIAHKKTNQQDDIISVYLLQSKTDLEQKTGESMITVILPIRRHKNGITEVISFNDELPQLFLYLPLLGSKKWGLNFLIHSPHFTCDKDTRDTLLFIGNGQNNEDQVAINRKLINLASRVIREYLNQNYITFENVKYLAKVKFGLSQSNEKLVKYYQTLQDEWVQYFESLCLVTKKTDERKNITVNSIRVLDEEMYKACEQDKDLLDAVYTLLSKTQYAFILPDKDDIIYWSRITNEWYVGKENKHAIRLDDIVELIQNTTITTIDLIWLHKLCSYFKNNNHEVFFQRRIVPNEALELKDRKSLVKPVEFNETFRSVMKVLIPDEVNTFVHVDFLDVVDNEVNLFGAEEAKVSLTKYITSLAPKSDVLKNTIIAAQEIDPEYYKNCCIPTDNVHAILDLYKMLLSESASGFTAKIYALLSEYYEYYPTTNDRLSKEEFDIRNCYNPLINDSLLRFSLTEDKLSKTNWCYKMVVELKMFSEANNFLRNYQVYPDQKGTFKYAQQLKKEENGIPKRLKEIYDIICRNVTHIDDSKSILHELVATEYAPYFIGESELKGKELSGEIERPFEDNKVISIENHPHSEQLLEIIEYISDGEIGKIWKSYFPTISPIRANLMLSVVTSPTKKDSIFKLVRLKDEERLKTIANLSEREDIEELVELGEIALEEKKQKAYIKMLGDYVETHIQCYLTKALEDIGVKVINQQGGQDFILSKEGYKDYRIEVKSRWATEESIEMSSLQFTTAVENADNFTLITVNMTHFDRERVERNEFIELSEMNSLIHVVDNIGHLEHDLKKRVTEAFRGEQNEIRVSGSYSVIVPQIVVKYYSKRFTDLIAKLKMNFI